MEHDLLGYLLDGLDPADSRRVEEALENSPELRTKLMKLRRLLSPLEADKEQSAPPPELYLTTLRLIAHSRVQAPPRKTAPPVQEGERQTARPWFRRSNLLVAAGVVFVAGMLVPYALLKVQRAQGLAACENNLKNHYFALRRYQEGHNGFLPALDPEGPLNMAGAAAVKLKEAGLWGEGMQVNCPGHANGVHVPPSLEEVKAYAAAPNDGSWKKTLSGCYAYPLGYWEGEGEARKLLPVGSALGAAAPILADRPPRPGESSDWRTGNSPNHGGLGQNVLFQDGHVQFLPARAHPSGVDKDIFTNAAGQIAPGLSRFDSVLAPSEVGLPAANTLSEKPAAKE